MKLLLLAWILGLTVPGLSAQTTVCPAPLSMPPQGEGWTALFDGDASDLDDWDEALDEPGGAWQVIDGILTHTDTQGGNHLFYKAGQDGREGPWGDLELVCEFRTDVGSNSGVYFRSEYTATGFPQAPHDLEAQINNTSNSTLNRRTGNLIPAGGSDCDDISCDSPTVDNEWNHMRILAYTVEGDLRVTIAINGNVIRANGQQEDYHGVNAANYPADGTICLQGEGLGHTYDRVEFRNVYVRHLPVTSCDGWDQGTPFVNEPLPLGQQVSQECLNITSETIAHYHFDSDFSNRAARTGRLTTTGNTELSSEDLGWMANPQGKAVKFGGAGDSLAGVLLEDDIYPSSGSEVTIEALIKIDFIKNHGDASRDLLKIHTGANRFWQLRMTKWDTSLSMSYHNDTFVSTDDFDASSFEYGKWFHFRFTYDSSGLARVYLNEEFVGGGMVSVPHHDLIHWSFHLGEFQGFVDEFRVSTKAYSTGGATTLPIDEWKERFFASGSPDAADDADADGDGFTTLAEYHLGLNPTKADGLGRFTATSTTHLMVIDYLKARQANGVNFKILGSQNLDDWSPETVNMTVSTHGLLFDRMQVHLSDDFTEFDSKFFGLGVTRSE